MDRPDYMERLGIEPVEPPAAIVPYLGSFAIFERFVAKWDRDDLPYRIRMTVGLVDGRPSCLGIECTAKECGEAVTGAGLRLLPVGRLLDAAVTGAVFVQGDGGDVHTFRTSREVNDYKKARRATRPRDRWQLTDEHLQEVARVYRSAVTTPVMAVADHWDKPRNTARRWVSEARDRGISLERTR